jgi:hypothetical protein
VLSIQDDLARRIDEGQVGQVIHNLIINADQVPNGGTIVSMKLHASPGDGLPLTQRKYKISVVTTV